MTPTDATLIVVLLAFTAYGLIEGMIRQLLSLAGFFIGLLLAFWFHGPLGAVLARGAGWPSSVATATAFAAILLTSWLAASGLALAWRRRADREGRTAADDVGGAVLGFLSGVMLLIALVAMAELLGLDWGTRLSRSQVGRLLLWLVPRSLLPAR